MTDPKKEAEAIGNAVEQTVSKLREEVLDRIVREKISLPLRRAHEPDLAELERELAVVEERLATWHLRREGASAERNADTRYTETNEKRAAALRTAIARLKGDA